MYIPYKELDISELNAHKRYLQRYFQDEGNLNHLREYQREYYEKNNLKEKQKIYTKNKMESDPEYAEKIRASKREYARRKREEKKKLQNNNSN